MQVQPQRDVRLDVLRGVAILLVLCHHAAVNPRSAGLLKLPAMALCRFGWSGVDLFFVLSGFLVGGLLFKELKSAHSLRIGRFLTRRMFKIWPAYYAYLLVLFIVALVDNHGAIWLSMQQLLPNLLHAQNYFGTLRGQTWSLAVEEHFYLTLPLLLYALHRWRKLHYLPFVAVTAMIFCTALRTTDWYHPPHEMVEIPAFGMTRIVPTHLRLDSLFAGVLIAYFYHFRPAVFDFIRRFRLQSALLGLFLVAPMAVFPETEYRFVWTYGFSFLYVGYGLMIASLMAAPLDKGLLQVIFASRVLRALAWIGTYSYSIYLWHLDLGTRPFSAIAEMTEASGFDPTVRAAVITLAYFTSAVVGGALLSKSIEFPCLRIRDRYFPATPTDAPCVPATAREEPAAKSSLVGAAR